MLLVQTGVLQTVSAFENFDEPKYRCLCSFTFVEAIARFDIFYLTSYCDCAINLKK